MDVTPVDRRGATAIRRDGEIARGIERGESESKRAEQRRVGWRQVGAPAQDGRGNSGAALLGLVGVVGA
jgi:hypothetical protein